MKSHFERLLVVLAVLTACQPMPEPTIKTDISATLSKGVISFKSLQDYEAFLTQTDEEIEAFLRAKHHQGFKSYAGSFLNREFEPIGGKNGEELLIDDDFFSRILNEEGIINIGDWFVRVNLPKEKAFALHQDHLADYPDLVNENLENNHVLEFSTDQEVLYVLAEMDGTTTQESRTEWWCTGADANRHEDNRNISGTNVYQHDTFLRYFRYAIGFTIEVQVKWRYRTANIIFNEWNSIKADNIYMVYNREYDIKCGEGGREWSPDDLRTALTTSATSKYNVDIYRGSKKLSDYRVEAQVFYEIPTSETSSTFVNRNTIQLRIEYTP